jgi:hypothetical protein
MEQADFNDSRRRRPDRLYSSALGTVKDKKCNRPLVPVLSTTWKSNRIVASVDVKLIERFAILVKAVY